MRAVPCALPGRLHRDAPGPAAGRPTSRPQPRALRGSYERLAAPRARTARATRCDQGRRAARPLRRDPMNPAKRRAIFERLREFNPNPRTELDYPTPFELLVAVILSAQGSPRASLALYRASQAIAAIRGHEFITPDDIKRLAPAILCHRIILKPESRLRKVTTRTRGRRAARHGRRPDRATRGSWPDALVSGHRGGSGRRGRLRPRAACLRHAGAAGPDADQPVPRPFVDHQSRSDPRLQPDRGGSRPVDRLRDHGQQPGPAAGRLGAGRRHAAARGDRLAAAAHRGQRPSAGRGHARAARGARRSIISSISPRAAIIRSGRSCSRPATCSVCTGGSGS